MATKRMTYQEYLVKSAEASWANDSAWDASPSLNNLNLRRIDISENKRTQSKRHAGISRDKMYLALIWGEWYVGKFHEEWYGWTYDGWKHNSMQLNGIDVLYEIDLPPMPNNLVAQPSSKSYIPHMCRVCGDYDSFKTRKNGTTYCVACGDKLDDE